MSRIDVVFLNGPEGKNIRFAPPDNNRPKREKRKEKRAWDISRVRSILVFSFLLYVLGIIPMKIIPIIAALPKVFIGCFLILAASVFCAAKPRWEHAVVLGLAIWLLL